LVGATVFGIGYGSAQNLTLLAAFSRAGASGATAASAMWNASFDAGTAIGALAVGWIAAGIGLPWTYVVVAAVLALAVPLCVAGEGGPAGTDEDQLADVGEAGGQWVRGGGVLAQQANQLAGAASALGGVVVRGAHAAALPDGPRARASARAAAWPARLAPIVL